MKTPLLFLTLAFPALAQVYTPPPAGGNTQPGTPTDTVTRGAPGNAPSGGVLGNELPFYNPAGETISWNGNTWAASDNRFFEARFQKYLNEPEESSESAKEYRNTIEEILALMSPHRKGGPSFREAVALLPRASSYPGDARLCDSLSNAIYTAMLAKKDIRGTKALIAAMEKEKKRLIRESDLKLQLDQRSDIGTTTRTTESEGSKTTEVTDSTGPGRGATSLKYLNSVKRIAEIEGLNKGHQLKSEVKKELAKIQYQALMVQFFLQRRFEHVIMASRFFNQIWKDGDGTLYLDDKSDLNQMFTKGIGVSPTVSTLDSLANEAMRDINKGVEAFIFLVKEEELESASKRLAESYMVGEFMPSINTLPRTKKRKVLEFVRGSYKLLNAIESKDFATAAEQIKALKNTAKDFDATKAQAAIAGMTRASNMAIGAAQIYFTEGKREEATAEITKATELWPLNPKLAEFDQLMSTGTTLARGRNDFDRLFAEKNYREVFKRRFELSPSLAHDSERKAKLEQVIKNIGTIELAIEGSKGLSREGHNYAAWEKLKPIYDRFPDDPKLNQVMTTMQGQASDLTVALQKAANLEKTGNIGSALSWFYQARHLHPGSTMAEEGIERLVDRALKIQ